MIYLDTNVLIYLMEDHGPISLKVADSLQSWRSNKQAFGTSVITITEFLAGTKTNDRTVLQQVPHLDFYMVDQVCAEQAASLQSHHQISIGDALHLATAILHKADCLYTNDRQLAKVAKDYLTVKTL